MAEALTGCVNALFFRLKKIFPEFLLRFSNPIARKANEFLLFQWRSGASAKFLEKKDLAERRGFVVLTRSATRPKGKSASVERSGGAKKQDKW